MHIKITLTDENVSIDPPNFVANHGTSTLKWKAKDESQRFDFDDPPITFDDPHAPMGPPSVEDGTASCMDVNNNTGKTNAPYSYHVHLITRKGKHITYPPKHDPAKDGHPTISNKPR